MVEASSQALEIMQNTLAELIARLPAVAIAIFIVLIGVRLSKYSAYAIRRTIARTSGSYSLQLVIGRLVRWLFIFITLLLATMIALPGFEPAELISLLGIGSVAIGFAFRDIFENFLAGILILLTEPFVIGDQIIVDGFEGTVEDIQIRATMLKTYDNRRVVIPNGQLYTDLVIVNTAFDKRRSEYDVGIGYDDDIAAAQQLCLHVMSEIEGVLDSPAPDTIMMELGDSAVIFRIRWWTDPHQRDLLIVQDKVLRTVKNRLTEAGFDLPFPIRTVYFTDETQR